MRRPTLAGETVALDWELAGEGNFSFLATHAGVAASITQHCDGEVMGQVVAQMPQILTVLTQILQIFFNECSFIYCMLLG